MIVVDASAIVAIVRHQAEEPIFTEILDASSAAIMSAVTFVETQLVLIGRRFQPDLKSIEATIAALGIEVVDVMLDQPTLAIRSFLAYGKGRHQAQLNLADCFSYALAKSRGAPLLFKGDDFAQTDVAPAWRP
jgi:ribonuclease VapC